MPAKKKSAAPAKTTATRKRTKKPAAKAASPTDNKTDAVSYRFDSMLTISNLSALRANLNKLAETESEIQLDASAIEVIDAAAIQLLLAFCIELRSRNQSISWQAPSQKLIASVSLLGLTQTLGIS